MLQRKMTEKRQLLNKKEILKNLSNLNKESLVDLTIFEVIGSTNDEARKKLDKVQNLEDSFAIFAEQQDAGRGRSGKKWESPANLNIYLSFAWNSSLKPVDLEGLSLSTAVAISQNLEPLLDEELKIKWPNDLFLSKKKVGGILVETFSSQKRTGIVVGVGLNVLMSAQEQISIDQEWTSLSLYFGKDFDRNLIAGLLLESLLSLRSNFEAKGFSFYKNDFERLNLLKNKECLVKFEGKTKKGFVDGITENGELIFKENGESHYLRFGEVSLKKI
mgnify:FL=1